MNTLLYLSDRKGSENMQLQLLERLRDIVETTQNGKFYKITIKSNGNQIVLDNYDDVTLYLQALVNAYNL